MVNSAVDNSAVDNSASRASVLTDEAAIIADKAALASAGRLYKRIWRWHFFAALLVVPFVLWQAITGTIYVWHEQIARSTHGSLMQVAPQLARASYQAQLQAAIAARPELKLEHIEVAAAANASTLFMFEAANGLPTPTFVNPYSAHVIASVSPSAWIPGWSRALHGGWPIDPVGSWMLELGASWAVVMILTGLYLWWPRAASGMAGVFYPRLKAGSRVFWRDVHSVIGMYFSIIVLVFLITALPWTDVWGNQILKPIQRALGQNAPAALGFGGGAHSEHAAAAGVSLLSLDQIIDSARSAGIASNLEIRLKPNGAPTAVRTRYARATAEQYLQIDAYSGDIVARASWADFPILAKVISTGVDLHEGTFFGVLNQWFNTLVAAVLVWLSISGFVGWYQRRPGAGLSAPRKINVRWPKAIFVSAIAVCVALPLLGLSVAVIALFEWISTRVIPVLNQKDNKAPM